MAGKFEAEPAWAEYFWDLVLSGEGDDCWMNDECIVTEVLVTQEDRERYPELTSKYVYLWEDSQGFVWTATQKSSAPEGGPYDD